MTNQQTRSRQSWIAGVVILATATLIMPADAAYADRKTIELPYTTKADLKSKCDAAKGEFDDLGPTYQCYSKGNSVTCDSQKKTCTAVTKFARMHRLSPVPGRVQKMPDLSPAED